MKHPTFRRTALAGAIAAMAAAGCTDNRPDVAEPVTDEFRVNTFTSGIQGSPSIATDADGDFIVVWSSYDQDGSGFGVYAQRYNAAGVAQGGEFQVNTFTTNAQSSASVAMDADGDFVVAWESDRQDGSYTGIYAQRYSAAGVVQGGEFRVNTFTTEFQGMPSVAMDANGNFVVAWESSGQDGSGDGIYAQRYNAAGVAQGSEFQVNTFTPGAQTNPSVAMDADGDFVVAWDSYFQDDGGGFSGGSGVYAQRYNADGVVQGGEFLVNTNTFSDQRGHSIAMDAGGDFVVAWDSEYQDGSGRGIYAQRYNAAGVAQGGEFRVSTFTDGDQRNPSIATDADGDFVVGWSSYSQDGSGFGVYAQRYDSAGTAQGSEFRVNTFTPGNQLNSRIAMDADGDFVVAWQSRYQDGAGYGVYAQRYSRP